MLGMLNDAHRSGQKQRAQSANELKRAAMRELFTRGLRGEAQKETEIGLMPESWNVEPLGSCVDSSSTDVTPSAEDPTTGTEYFLGSQTYRMDSDLGLKSAFTTRECDESSLHASRSGRLFSIAIGRIRHRPLGKAMLRRCCAVFRRHT